MKKILFYLFFTAVVTIIPLAAQDKDDDESDRRENSYWNRVKIGGAGGVTPMAGMFNNNEIDKFLSASGLPTFGTDPMYLIGGEGYGYIMFLKNVRMGGFGASGTKTTNILQPMSTGGTIKKEVQYDVSYGGFLIDYVQPVAYRLDIAIGATIGGGSVDLTMRRHDDKFDAWDTLWNNFKNPNSQSTNYTHHMNGSFVVFTPHINIEYTLLTWLQLRIGAGYPMMFSPEWKLDDKYDVNGVPTKIKLDGYTVNAGIMFGYFGW
ncbi:MAG: hypothetical protein WCI84_10375 [Bacteroidota bacterium]